jgi:hypothetical protein
MTKGTIQEGSQHPGCSGTMFERHLSPAQLADRWGYSVDTIRRWFEDGPGVVKCGGLGGRGKRRRISLRIPLSVAARVYQERTR